jgi:predicted O-methyltransferase YrrM
MQLTRGLGAVLLGALLLAGTLHGQGRRGRSAGGGLDNPPLANSAAEQKILDVAAVVERHLNVPQGDGRIIRLLTESIGAKKAVEIGTSTGYSGLWFAMALRNTGGKLVTLEYDPGRAEVARKNFEKAGVGDIVEVIAGDAHETIRKIEGPVDIVFIDADKPGYRDYLEKILPKVRPGGLILAHNISSRAQNPEYVDAVTGDAALETVLFDRQMTVTLKKLK